MADNEKIAEIKEEEIKEEETKEENTESAEENKEESGEEKKTSTKSLLTKCIAAVLCTAIAGYTVSGSIGKLADAKKPAESVSASQSGEVSSDSGDFGGYDASADAGDFSTGDDTAAPVDGGDTSADSGSSDSSASSDTSSSSGSTDSKTDAGKPADSKPASAASMNKSQIVTLFNNSANTAKVSAKSIKQNYTKNTQVTGIELSNKMLANLADKLISANMGEDETKHNKTYTTAGDKNGYFPVAGQTWASKLTDADVKEATVKENGGNYDVVIKLVDDTQANLKVGEGHAGKAISLVTKEQIVEGAGSAGMAVIKEESIKVTHSGCVIKATIDKATGKMKTANYYRVWKLQLTALGIDIGISFGIEEDFVINW